MKKFRILLPLLIITLMLAGAVTTASAAVTPSLTTDKTEYMIGEAINVTAKCDAPGSWVALYKATDVPGTNTFSFYWDYVTTETGLNRHNGETFNLALYANTDNTRTMTPGAYKIILFGDSGYNKQLVTKNITLLENPNPPKGKLTVSGFTRDDKVYGEDVKGYVKDYYGKPLYEYTYGDSFTVKADVSGYGVDKAWVGIMTDYEYSKGNTKNIIPNYWYYVKDFPGQAVNLDDIIESKLTPDAPGISYGLDFWFVLVSDGGQILDGVPFISRTFNMDWIGTDWGEAVSNRIAVELDWTSKLANGQNQRPKVTIKQVNGHFGYKKDANGKLVEITEEVLQEGRDYTLVYPAESKEVGAYNIKVNFFKSGSSRNYLSTTPARFGLQDGITYYLTDSESAYVIQYNLNGGSNHDDNPVMYKTGNAVVLKSPSKPGYIFGGWFTKADFAENSRIEQIAATDAKQYTLYAKWLDESTAKYKIHYELYGGDNSAYNPSGYNGDVAFSPDAPKRTGYVFEGWFFDAAFTRPADTVEKGTTGDLTLYAKFTKKDVANAYIATEVKGGTITADRAVRKGESVKITYKPNNGYVLSSVTVDGVKVSTTKYGSYYTFSNVTGDHKISVVYKIKLGKVTMKNLTTGNKQIAVSWKAVNRAKEYKVYRSTNGKTYKLIKTTTSLKYVDKNVKAGKKYYYKVSASANGVIGTKSNAKSIKASKALAKVKITSAKVKNSKITVKWKKVTGAAKYKVYRSADKGKTYKLITTTKKLSHTSGKMAAKQYRYKISAVKNGFEGKASAVKKVTVKKTTAKK